MSMQTNVDVFKAFCRECLLDFAPLPTGTFLTIFPGERYQWPIYYEVLERGGRFLSKLPIVIPQNKRHEVGILIHTANNFLVASGGFQFDIDTGAVRFATAIDIADGDLTVCQLVALYEQHRIVDYWIEKIVRVVVNRSRKPDEHTKYMVRQPTSKRRRASLHDLLKDVDVDLD